MAKEFDVIIYMRHIKLDVVIPEPHVWCFMEQFGNVFAINDVMEGGKVFKPVDGYYAHPGGWHVQVVIWEKDEERFYDFLKKFCKEKEISFRDPRQKQ